METPRSESPSTEELRAALPSEALQPMSTSPPPVTGKPTTDNILAPQVVEGSGEKSGGTANDLVRGPILKSMCKNNLKVTRRRFSMRQIYGMSIHGCILRSICKKQVDVLEKIPVGTLFDEKLASVPVFFTCSSVPGKLIIAEGNHRITALLNQEPTNETFAVDCVELEADDFNSAFSAAPDLLGKDDETSQKCRLDAIPWKVASHVQRLFTSERLRTENAYSPKDRAMNLLEILTARVAPENVSSLVQSQRLRTQLYNELVEDKLAIVSTQSRTEQSGVFLFLSAPKTKQQFMAHFEKIPTKEKTHYVLFRASWKDDKRAASLVRQVGLGIIDKMTFVQEIKDLKNGVADDDDEKEGEKTGEKRGHDLKVWGDISGVPNGSMLLVQKEIPHPDAIKSKDLSLVVIDPPQTKSFYSQCVELAPNEAIRTGVYRKSHFVSFGKLVKPGEHFTTTTLNAMVQRVTGPANNRKRKLPASDETTKGSFKVGTLRGFEPH